MFHADGIEIEGVKSSMLNNVGLLCATLVDGTGEEVVKVSALALVLEGSVAMLIARDSRRPSCEFRCR